MKLDRIARGVALALCLSLLLTCALGEEAPVAPPVDAPVPEAAEGALTDDALAADAAFALAAEEADPPEETATPEGTATPQPTATPKPKLKEKVFSETLSIKNRTYKSVNLVRSPGFKKAFAKVTGTLTLNNVRIRGVAARRVNLIRAFELGPTGSIVVLDDAELTGDVSAFSFNKGDTRVLSLTYRGAPLKGTRAK